MAPAHRLRPATLDDVDLLVRHRRGMWVDMEHGSEAERDAHDEVYRTWAQDGMKAGTLHAWVAEDAATGNALASGCVWVRAVQPFPGSLSCQEPYLLSMYTEPAARGRGLAKAIVEAAIAWSREAGHAKLRLHASDMGRSIYEKAGFERTWEMRLDLDDTAPAC